MMRLIHRLVYGFKTPKPQIYISPELWKSLHADLQQRSRGTRESGAFLLGHKTNAHCTIEDYVLYDDLDPQCLNEGYVNFQAKYYRDLWDICRDKKMSVVADVHTHPGIERPSIIDDANPMISERGHIALIIPYYARNAPNVERTSVSQYLGRGCWRRVVRRARAKSLLISAEGL